MWAFAALGLFAVLMLVIGAWRRRIQVARTGDSGNRRRWRPDATLEWWALALADVGYLLVGIAAPAAALAGTPALGIVERPWVHAAGAVVAVVGITATLLAQLGLGASWRIGVEETETTDLVTTGPFALVRNPIFTALLFTLTGLALMVPNPVAVVGLVVAVAGIELQVRGVEEPYLRRVHGHAYSDYTTAVGRFVPTSAAPEMRPMMLPDTTTDFNTVEVTVAFVDLAGYSVLTEACGDREAAQLATRLVELAHTALQPGVRVVKTIGDAVMLAADTPAQMTATIIDLADRVAGEDGFLPIRAGIHHGPAIARGGDFFGHVVNIAARITALAGAGQAVITDAIVDAVSEYGLPTTPMGLPPLRNITAAIPLHMIALAAACYPRDPVCGMRIDPATAPAHHHREGWDWWFCSTDCAHRFITNSSMSTPQQPPVAASERRPR